MQRRRYLAVAVLFVAGCNGQSDSESTTTSTPTATATSQQTPTPTETPTATPTQTPTAAEREANEAIEEVQNTLDAAVMQYGGADSDDILEMDAAGDFSSSLLSRTLAEAEDELQRARELVVTEAQRVTVERLTVAHRFLRLAFEVQNGLTNAYFNLNRARPSLDDEDTAEARDRLRSMRAELTIARQPYQRIPEETNGDAVAVVPRLDGATYDAKLAQFDAEFGAFSSVDTLVNRLADGINRLVQARLEEADDDPETAEAAERAAVELEDVADSLASFVESTRSTPGDSLVPAAERFATLAARKAAVARDIEERTRG